MTAPATSSTVSAATAAPSGAVPPYVAPATTASSAHGALKVGPFVPASVRPASGDPMPPSAGAPVATAPSVTVHATPDAPARPTPLEALAVSAGIPPYRPLRPTPIVTPAIRTPLYIPPIPTPSAEAAVADVDEGVIDPKLVDTAEFPVPSGAWQSLTPLDSPAVEPSSPSGAGELPWIDAFLSSTPSAPVAAIPAPLGGTPVTPATPVSVEAFTDEGFLVSPAADAAEDPPLTLSSVEPASAPWELEVEPPAEVESVAEMFSDSEPEVAGETWPLDEAAAELRSFGAQLEPAADPAPAASGDALQGFEAPAMSAWGDDDLMDIMPIRHSALTPLSNAAMPSDEQLWDERARSGASVAIPPFVPPEEPASAEARGGEALYADPAGTDATSQAQADGTIEPTMASASTAGSADASAEAAAHALEVLARRVRSGELALPGYDPGMGEPAALVAALAALLGVRLR